MDQSIVDDLVVALDRAINADGKLNAKLVVAELARADLTVKRLHRPSASGDDSDDVYDALAKLHANNGLI